VAQPNYLNKFFFINFLENIPKLLELIEQFWGYPKSKEKESILLQGAFEKIDGIKAQKGKFCLLIGRKREPILYSLRRGSISSH